MQSRKGNSTSNVEEPKKINLQSYLLSDLS